MRSVAYELVERRAVTWSRDPGVALRTDGADGTVAGQQEADVSPVKRRNVHISPEKSTDAAAIKGSTPGPRPPRKTPSTLQTSYFLGSQS